MWRLNLKAMYNDPSQMREALAWHLFSKIGIPSSRHSYVKLAINDTYMGLFSLIEQVDKPFLKDFFGKNDDGNLYKAYCGNVGCATLEHRKAQNGDDSGVQYYEERDHSDLTYRLKSNEDDPAANTYDDLAKFVRTLNGIGLPGGEHRFASGAYKESMERIMNVKAFLRWASVNLLIGSWDNYFATPANYYLYNSGKKGGSKNFMADPYFTWIPWDYDNSFGIDFFNTQWQFTDIVDWAANTENYNGGKGVSKIPLIKNLLSNDEFKRYYLDHLEHMLDTEFAPDKIAALIGTEGGGGLWDRVRQAAYLESNTPHDPPFTGRQFSNDTVYRSGLLQNEVVGGNYKVEGIVHYVRMRYDSARKQLATLRQTYPRGAIGASFTGVMEALPKSA
jgi:spore coat protein CotH